MKTALYTLSSVLLAGLSYAQVNEQEGPDTTRMNMGKVEIIIVDHENADFADTIDASPSEEELKNFEAHWAGLDMGFGVMLNNAMSASFDNYDYWENDPARSMTWNLNLLEYKFPIFRQYVGITTGLGVSWTQLAFRDNYLLQSGNDTLFAIVDTVNAYSKNKLNASYLTVPVLLEFATNEDADKSFYLAAGVVGGVRMTSKVKRKGEFEGKEFKQEDKGVYGLNAFKLDGMVRIGYGSFGAFASYSLLPLFDTEKTTEVYPLTFGLTINF
ncbi:MAG: outer membrane beta-barrel protein [Bacteroidota bacterium]